MWQLVDLHIQKFKIKKQNTKTYEHWLFHIHLSTKFTVWISFLVMSVLHSSYSTNRASMSPSFVSWRWSLSPSKRLRRPSKMCWRREFLTQIGSVDGVVIFTTRNGSWKVKHIYFAFLNTTPQTIPNRFVSQFWREKLETKKWFKSSNQNVSQLSFLWLHFQYLKLWFE